MESTYIKLSFKNFLLKEELEEEKNDIKNMLEKIPQKHANLVKNFKFKFQPGNTLKGDKSHVGYMSDDHKEICVAAPWNYGREFTVLHEVGHKVWEQLLDNKSKEKWSLLIKKYKKNENPEELFCMAYAATYSKHPPITYYKKDWINFIKKLNTVL